ncbi:MAG: tetratricopeptide repeat protein [Myxococcota bacterium]|nr:tetratricopeptide repeat protein [Myxococcota bacterium]
MKAPGVAVFCLVALASGVAGAADEGRVVRAQAAQLASAGRCDAALPLLEQARRLSPDDAPAALLQGKCLLHGKRYAAALEPLETAVRLDPDSPEAALYLGMTQYHLGDSDAAEATLARAEQLAPDNAEVALYRGLTLLDLARTDEATERFNRASRIDTANMEPMASYYAGLAHQSMGRTAEAEAALRRVSRLAPGSEWDRQAEAALSSAPSGPASYALRRWLVLQAGLSYDSNVALVGTDVTNPEIISGRSDGRGDWSAETGLELYRDERWSAGVLANYYGNAYFRETEFDQAYVNASFWVERRLGQDSFFRIQPMFGTIYYDYEDYLRFYGFRAAYLHDWGDAGSGDFWLRYAYNDFLYPIPPPDTSFRNRDGNDLWFGYDHSYDVTDTTTLEGGPLGRVYAAKGGEWDFWGIGGWVGVIQQLPAEFAGEISFAFQHDRYDHPSSFPVPGANTKDRRDNLYRIRAGLERPIFKNVIASLDWTYWNNDSNTSVFNYERHVAGGYITIAFGD